MLALIFNKDYPTGNWLTQKSWFQQIQQNFALKCQASKSFFFFNDWDNSCRNHELHF